MKTTIAKQFTFDSAHFLPRVPDGHKCKNMHGHTYVVEIRVVGDPLADPEDRSGWIVDYADIAAAWAPIAKLLDHHVLNEVVGLTNPTTEMLAPWILRRLWIDFPRVSSVRVYESSTTWCEVSIEDLA
jgi:6-pyruvoyltetrahydropterin/6-carboxytetrahydropterin synthase